MMDELLNGVSSFTADTAAKAVSSTNPSLLLGILIGAGAVGLGVAAYEMGAEVIRGVGNAVEAAVEGISDAVAGLFKTPEPPIAVGADGTAYLPGTELIGV